MSAPRTIASWLWKLAVGGAAMVAGVMLGGLIATALGLEMPRMVPGVDATTQFLLMVPGGMALAAGLAAMAVGLAGRRWERWAVLAAFAYVVHGIGNTLEGSIYTTLGGELASLVIRLPASLLCALAVTLLFPVRSDERLVQRAAALFSGWKMGRLVARLGLALLAFPFFYFLFGTIITPIVIPHYERLDFLVIPPLPTILTVLFIRSAMLLLVSLPVIAAWRESRAKLILGLALGHFVTVGLADLIQATFLPAVLRWTHSLEILADSVCYAWVLVALFFVERGGGAEERVALRQEGRSRGGAKVMNPQGILTLAGKIVALTFVLLLVQAIGALFLPAMEGAGQGAESSSASQPTAQPAPGFLGLVLLACFLQTVALAYPIVRSRWRGWLLVVTVAVLFFGTVTFMSQIESLVYMGGKMPPGMLQGLFLMGLFNAVAFSPIIVLTLGGWKTRGAPSQEPGLRLRMSPRSWAWKLAVGATVYFALYYLFGYYVAWKNPAVRDFYGGTDPGTFLAQMRGIVRGTPWMVLVQFLRGLLWVLLALPVIRMMRGPWWEAGVAVSLLFTVPVIYLLFPNPLMPEAVRLTHLVETAPYQFLFGWFVVWLFTRGIGGHAQEKRGQALN